MQHTVAIAVGEAVDEYRVDVQQTLKNKQRSAPRSKLARAGRKQLRPWKQKSGRPRTTRKAQQRKANVSQSWLTVLWHVGSGLPLDFRAGPSDSSECGHPIAMLSTLPRRSMLTADTGFTGQGADPSNRHSL